MKQTPRIYIIGPFRAPTEYERRANIARAESAALMAAKAGAFYRCPHLHSAHFEGLCDDAYWLALGIDLLMGCDAALLAPDKGGYWAPGARSYLMTDRSGASHGSIAEVAMCARMGAPLLFDQDDLDAYMAAWACGDRHRFEEIRDARKAEAVRILNAALEV